MTEEIRAKRFVLEDENGKTRAALWMCEGDPSLTLSDGNGKPRATLAVHEGKGRA